MLILNEIIVLDSNNWNHFTIAIQMCKQISSNSFKNEITDKLLNYKPYVYIHLNVCK